MAYCKVTYDDLGAAVARQKEKEPAAFVRVVCTVLLILVLLSSILSTFIFSFLVVTMLLAAPGMFVNYGDVIKEKIRSLQNSKKTN